MEDAISLGVIFPANTPAAEVPERLKLYQDIRYGRASYVQNVSRLNGLNTDKKPKGRT